VERVRTDVSEEHVASIFRVENLKSALFTVPAVETSNPTGSKGDKDLVNAKLYGVTQIGLFLMRRHIMLQKLSDVSRNLLLTLRK
jgi:hypothetical protein